MPGPCEAGRYAPRQVDRAPRSTGTHEDSGVVCQRFGGRACSLPFPCNSSTQTRQPHRVHSHQPSSGSGQGSGHRVPRFSAFGPQGGMCGAAVSSEARLGRSQLQAHSGHQANTGPSGLEPGRGFPARGHPQCLATRPSLNERQPGASWPPESAGMSSGTPNHTRAVPFVTPRQGQVTGLATQGVSTGGGGQGPLDLSVHSEGLTGS